MIVSPSTAMRALRGKASRTSRTRRCGSIGTPSASIARASVCSFWSRFSRSAPSQRPSELASVRPSRAARSWAGRRRRVGHDAELEVGAAGELLRLEVDLRDPRAVGEAPGAAEAEDPVEASTDHQDGVGLAERGAPGAVHEARVVVRDRPAAHRRADVGDAEVRDRREVGARARPRGALAEQEQRALGGGEHLGHAVDGVRVGVGPRDLRRTRAPARLAFVDSASHAVPGVVEVDGARPAGDGLAEGQVQELRDALGAVDGARPFAARVGEGHLVGLLEAAQAAGSGRRWSRRARRAASSSPSPRASA